VSKIGAGKSESGCVALGATVLIRCLPSRFNFLTKFIDESRAEATKQLSEIL
jgi:hypothetical protein